jgi:hypothetical protein
MVDHAERALIGAAANRKGKAAEQAVARYLREHGWPDAARTVRTGWANERGSRADVGDIDGTSRLVWQVKTGASDMSGASVPRSLAETVNQAIAAGADYGLLVVRRSGKSDPGQWWVWLGARDFRDLLRGDVFPAGTLVDFPIRAQLGDLVGLLKTAGYSA